jgi:hypothetical protein
MEKTPSELPVEATQEIGLYAMVEDSSCHLVLKVEDSLGGNERELPLVVLPYPFARALHDQLAQYIARQQVFDREFRNPPA